jgi:hypothetical protein
MEIKGVLEVFKCELPVNVCTIDRQINSLQEKEQLKHWE